MPSMIMMRWSDHHHREATVPHNTIAAAFLGTVKVHGTWLLFFTSSVLFRSLLIPHLLFPLPSYCAARFPPSSVHLHTRVNYLNFHYKLAQSYLFYCALFSFNLFTFSIRSYISLVMAQFTIVKGPAISGCAFISLAVDAGYTAGTLQ